LILLSRYGLAREVCLKRGQVGRSQSAAGFVIYTEPEKLGYAIRIQEEGRRQLQDIRTRVYTLNSRVCPGSCQPPGLTVRATLSAALPVFRRPAYSAIRLGGLPAAVIIVGVSIRSLIHWLNRCRTVRFTSPKQHTPDGFLDSHAQSPSRMSLEIVSGTVVAPVSEISSRICFSSKPKQ
jgi:hypothetical protein